jgi:hypothetical protein
MLMVDGWVLLLLLVNVLELTLSLCFVMSLVVSLSLSYLQSLKESAWLCNVILGKCIREKGSVVVN